MALLLDYDYYQYEFEAKNSKQISITIPDKNFTWFGNAKLGLTACGVGIWCTGPVLNWDIGCGVGIDCWLTAPLE